MPAANGRNNRSAALYCGEFIGGKNARSPFLVRIGDRVFVGPGVIFTNDPYPMSDKMVGVTVEDDAIVCAGSVLRPGITIGARSVIGMGAIVTRDVPPESVVFGNPATEKYTREIYLKKKAEWEKE